MHGETHSLILRLSKAIILFRESVPRTEKEILQRDFLHHTGIEYKV